MKTVATLIAIFISAQVFAQSSTENKILALSKDKFRWEVDGKVDSIENLLDDSLVIVTSTGATHFKADYIAGLKSGHTVHNSIDVQEASARIVGTTGIITGKGVFAITANNNKATYNLSYMEVYVKRGHAWKLVALHASRLQG